MKCFFTGKDCENQSACLTCHTGAGWLKTFGGEEKIRKDLEDEENRWKDIRKNGAGDPFWSDGVNINLVRNHIVHYVSGLRQLGLSADYEIPPKVDQAFMARKRAILAKARRNIASLKKDRDYQYLLSISAEISEKERQKLGLLAGTGIVRDLERAVAERNYNDASRHDLKHDKARIRKIAEYVRRARGDYDVRENGQLRLPV